MLIGEKMTSQILSVSLLLFLSTSTIASAIALPGPTDSKKNVLLIFIDDGGFQMGVYGNKAVKTPNIDNFAKRAVVFKHGFTSVSSCSPSRSALLTGSS